MASKKTTGSKGGRQSKATKGTTVPPVAATPAQVTGGIGQTIETLIAQEVARRVSEVLKGTGAIPPAAPALPKAAARGASEATGNLSIVPPAPAPVVVAGGKVDKKPRQRASFREAERRQERYDILVNTLKQGGVFVNLTKLNAYIRIDLTTGNIALRGRDVLIRQFNIAPVNKHVTHLTDQQHGDYYLGAIAVARIDDFESNVEWQKWCEGLVGMVRARMTTH